MSNGEGKQVQCEPVYIASGCNRYSSVADVREQDGLVAYGAGKLVALWKSENPNHGGVYQTLPGHTGDVTSVKFLRSSDKALHCSAVVTGDSDGNLITWVEDAERGFIRATDLTVPGSIASLACIEEHPGRFIIAAGSSQSEIHIFKYAFQGEFIRMAHDMLIGSRIPLSMAMGRIATEHSIIMLAVGTTDSKVHILTQVCCDDTLAASDEVAGSLTGPSPPLFKHQQSLSGHADWVRSLDFAAPMQLTDAEASGSGYQTGDVLLASGSQDTYTRVWRITPTPAKSDVAAKADPSQGLDRLMEGEIDAKRYSFTHENYEISIHAESVLLGHENWVTSVHWHTREGCIPRLLTASADRSMMMWSLDPSSMIWLSSNRFGEIGGTNLGFFGALWGQDARTILAHGWGGSFHVWHQDNKSSLWKSQLSISGHYGSVTSLAWESEGRYLISVSSDQTARLHGPWQRHGVATWHELARPQIHGYDMEDVAFLGRLRYISGSEEKIVRVFDAPAAFIDSMRRLGVDDSLQDDGQRPKAAAVPALGLSNKAVFEGNGEDQEDQSLVAKSMPPLEEQLLTATLWPETEKLYGHGYEINAIAASHDGRFIASACRSTTPEHAVVRVHRTSNWSQIMPPLAGHSLTVTSIRFSPDDKYILTCSRDRSWQLYERSETGDAYAKKSSASRAHARIIWDCAWARDSSFFATAARDKQVKVWQPVDSESSSWKVVSTLSLPDAATAVSVTRLNDLHIMAVGTETGSISVYTSAEPQSGWHLVFRADSSIAHCSTVRTVQWQPGEAFSDQQLLLASGSDDRSLRVLRFSF